MSEVKTAPCVATNQTQVAEKVLRLFALSSEVLNEEAEREAYLTELSHEFLRRDNISADGFLSALAEDFLESHVPEMPGELSEYLDYLQRYVILNSINTSSPRFIGHMTTALPHFVRPLSHLLTALNQNLVKLETSKSLSFCERQSLAMMHRLIYRFEDEFYDQHIQHRDSTLGMIVSGGTVANLTGLWCAYNAALGPHNALAGVDKVGLPAALSARGYSGAVIIGSSLMHYSLDKAAGLLGLGTNNLIRVPVDARHRIDLKALRETIAGCRAENKLIVALVGNAGTTDSGAIDPLVEVAQIAREAGVHFHVDAAWGGALLFSRHHQDRLAGIELADSVTIDGHKQLYLPMGIGMVLLRNPHLARVIERNAQYIIRANSLDLGKRALEGSRPAMVLYLHAALHLIGRQGYEVLIDENLRKTDYMAQHIRERSEFQLLTEPQMNILNYRAIPSALRSSARHGQLSDSDNKVVDEFNLRLQRTQRQEGKSFVSRTMLNVTGPPLVALRAVIANPLTTEADIKAVLDQQLDLVNRSL